MREVLDISLVIPVFNEDESLEELYRWIRKVMSLNGFRYELIFIDDGSSDQSWDVIIRLVAQDTAVRGIRLSRNYGKSAALGVGFEHAAGEVVITMDADLQDDPEEIPEMYELLISEKYDLVSGWKKKRKDPLSKTIPSKFFNWTTRMISGIELHDFNCGFKAYRSDVVKQIAIYGEMHRYIPVIAKWSGFSHIAEKPVKHHPRKYGVTKFGFERFIRGFLDLLSITFVTKFKQRPMHFFGSFGILSFFGGFVITLWIIGEKLYYQWLLNKLPPRDVVEQPLFFLALVALVVGVQLFLAGFISELITKSSSQTDDYIVREKIGY
ncbi:MAG: glycosyl transferase [Cyclobacteriaceae bacterium]|nr:MAG: glycosyl transferase [Cyclobacteriaceae bacterium]